MKIKKYSLIPILFIALILFGVSPVFALQDPTPAPTIDIAWAAFFALVGWPAFQVAVINLLKIVKIVPDGAAGKVTFWSSAVAFVGVAVLVFTGQLDLLSTIDATLSNLAILVGNIIVILGGSVASLAFNKFYYGQVRGLPLFGYSHSLAGTKKK